MLGSTIDMYGSVKGIAGSAVGTIKALEDEHNKLNSEAQIDDIAIPESFQEGKELEK